MGLVVRSARIQRQIEGQKVPRRFKPAGCPQDHMAPDRMRESIYCGMTPPLRHRAACVTVQAARTISSAARICA